jgi:hypothetical protein
MAGLEYAATCMSGSAEAGWPRKAFRRSVVPQDNRLCRRIRKPTRILEVRIRGLMCRQQVLVSQSTTMVAGDCV